MISKLPAVGVAGAGGGIICVDRVNKRCVETSCDDWLMVDVEEGAHFAICASCCICRTGSTFGANNRSLVTTEGLSGIGIS